MGVSEIPLSFLVQNPPSFFVCPKSPSRFWSENPPLVFGPKSPSRFWSENPSRFCPKIPPPFLVRNPLSFFVCVQNPFSFFVRPKSPSFFVSKFPLVFGPKS